MPSMALMVGQYSWRGNWNFPATLRMLGEARQVFKVTADFARNKGSEFQEWRTNWLLRFENVPSKIQVLPMC
jgi:hypothetical protein